uniref:Uncharacterized protein n=1 Tax=Anguilla anguilla TaxID=7936 RepID=A0A0E9S4C9_ANGAN
MLNVFLIHQFCLILIHALVCLCKVHALRCKTTQTKL